jgi:uncharacterized SAM-binding protein YcdF (DUF218 family)
MVLLTRYLAWFCYPLPLCVELLVAGLLFLWFGKRQAVGRALVTLATVLLVLFSWGPFSRMLLRPMESTYPPLLDPQSLPGGTAQTVRWIVVLGSGFKPDANIPPGTRLDRGGIVRLVEGVRLHRKLPGTRLIVSVGGETEGDLPTQTIKELAEAFGIDLSDLVIERGAKNTAEEVQEVAKKVQTDPFVLVTSASHLSRAVRLFRDKGMNPIPAPAEYRGVENAYPFLHDLPSETNLDKTREGFYEVLASAWRAIIGH